MRKRFIFLIFMLISVLINIIPLFAFKEKIVFSEFSYIPVFVMTLVSANGILSYFLRHKKNYLSFGTPRGGVFDSDQDYTFSKEYVREFYWQFIVYWVAIPFYIPCVFFSTVWIHTLWTLCVIFVPQLVFVAYGIFNTFNDVKDYHATQLKQDQELKEQEKREEMGRFKQ